ncbi:MAG TPA: hypothetical protein PLN19_07955 [Methanothrix sp.]|nr:hypothetical protein [Methanothrix sp.]HOV82636.1 hypothetical protein [Methanothrix sp.]HPC90381.1 hypothetical protein [Methanothrix sp.]HQE88188.1 hypothetical protein [Methanothrix sp.]HQI68787.1 hypothetical protein [Methanothrix sp.]
MNREEMMELKRPVIEACIKSAQKNGWSDAMGLLRGTLFLEEEPLSLDMLAERTGYGKTAIRTNMSYLESMGMARRAAGPRGKILNLISLYQKLIVMLEWDGLKGAIGWIWKCRLKILI